MKLATFQGEGSKPRIGIAIDGDTRLFDLAYAARQDGKPGPFASMLDLIDSGPAGLDHARDLLARRGGDPELSVARADVRLLAPLPEPRQMRDGMSFPLHILQAGRGVRLIQAGADAQKRAAIMAEPLPPLPQVYRDRPIYYLTNRLVVRGPDAVIRWPRYSRVMDYELEFGVVLGRTGANIAAADARDHIFGFTIFNDFSARDAQALEMPGMLGPAKGKSFDGANVIGPFIVTPDEIGDPYALAMRARVNGETRCEATSAGMLFSFEEIIAYMSRDETLVAGEFIGSGTVGGGCGLETGRFLEHGDTIELEVEKIGVLRNRVERQDI